MNGWLERQVNGHSARKPQLSDELSEHLTLSFWLDKETLLGS